MEKTTRSPAADMKSARETIVSVWMVAVGSARVRPGRPRLHLNGVHGLPSESLLFQRKRDSPTGFYGNLGGFQDLLDIHIMVEGRWAIQGLPGTKPIDHIGYGFSPLRR